MGIYFSKWLRMCCSSPNKPESIFRANVRLRVQYFSEATRLGCSFGGMCGGTFLKTVEKALQLNYYFEDIFGAKYAPWRHVWSRIPTYSGVCTAVELLPWRHFWSENAPCSHAWLHIAPEWWSLHTFGAITLGPFWGDKMHLGGVFGGTILRDVLSFSSYRGGIFKAKNAPWRYAWRHYPPNGGICAALMYSLEDIFGVKKAPWHLSDILGGTLGTYLEVLTSKWWWSLDRSEVYQETRGNIFSLEISLELKRNHGDIFRDNILQIVVESLLHWCYLSISSLEAYLEVLTSKWWWSLDRSEVTTIAGKNRHRSKIVSLEISLERKCALETYLETISSKCWWSLDRIDVAWRHIGS